MTGSSGTVGGILRGINAEITPFDLPSHDARSLEDLTLAAAGHDAIIHLAWDVKTEGCNVDQHSESINPDNTLMYINAYKAAKAANVSRVVMASSVHADDFTIPRRELLSPDDAAWPHCPYGANKLLMEALGRFYASKDLGVVCLRLGAVRAENDINQLGLTERHLWLNHEDVVSVVNKAIAAKLPKNNYVVAYAVSDNLGRIHDTASPLD
jgi:nucleoside-diphosphate-sugar epimerase